MISQQADRTPLFRTFQVALLNYTNHGALFDLGLDSNPTTCMWAGNCIWTTFPSAPNPLQFRPACTACIWYFYGSSYSLYMETTPPHTCAATFLLMCVVGGHCNFHKPPVVSFHHGTSAFWFNLYVENLLSSHNTSLGVTWVARHCDQYRLKAHRLCLHTPPKLTQRQWSCFFDSLGGLSGQGRTLSKVSWCAQFCFQRTASLPHL